MSVDVSNVSALWMLNRGCEDGGDEGQSSGGPRMQSQTWKGRVSVVRMRCEIMTHVCHACGLTPV